MQNVLNFRKRAPRLSESTAQPLAANAGVDIDALVSRISGLQSAARGEIGNAVLMLDLAARHAREIASRLTDPTARKNFDEHIATIERMLQLAREMALKV
jgi:hypothetical protein